MAYKTKKRKAEYQRQYYLKHREAFLDNSRKQREKDHDAYLLYQRRYREANLERLREQVRQYQKENREAINQQGRESYDPQKAQVANRKWYEANRDKAVQTAKQYRQKNYNEVLRRNRQYRKDRPDKAREMVERYREKHPEVRKTAGQNRSARKRGATGTHTTADIKAIWDRQGERCAVPDCIHPIAAEGKSRYHVDHIMPLILGGSNGPSNLQILCRHHNVTKHALHPDVWAKRIGHTR